jgi:hypothetical protein
LERNGSFLSKKTDVLVQKRKLVQKPLLVQKNLGFFEKERKEPTLVFEKERKGKKPTLFYCFLKFLIFAPNFI